MLNGLRSGQLGLQAQTVRMDTVANNIANLNSMGFKRSEVSFQDAEYRELTSPGQPVTGRVTAGGGVTVCAVDRDLSTGPLVPTGRYLDVAIDGNGFFAISLPDGSRGLTRNGQFFRDASGYLVNSQGSIILPGVQIPSDCTSFSISPEGEITGTFLEGEARDLGEISLFYVSNPQGLQAMGNGIYIESPASGAAAAAFPGDQDMGLIKQGFLEQSNVNLAQEMVQMISAQRSFQLSAKTIRTADELWSLANAMRR